MGIGMGLHLSHKLEQRIQIAIPTIQWSLLSAYQGGKSGPPPFVPPTFDEEIFEPRLKLERRTIVDFETLDHVRQMQLVDKANEIFRFAYTRGRNENDEEKGYFKIPLLRDMNADVEKIKIRISRAEYVLATAMLSAVGEMERIARAVPYHGLYKAMTGTPNLRHFFR